MQINVILPLFAVFTCLEFAVFFGIIYVKVSRKSENATFSLFCACIAWMMWYTLRLQEVQHLSQALLLFRLQFAGAFLGMAALIHFAACITQYRLSGLAHPLVLYAASLLMAAMAFYPHVLHPLPSGMTLKQFREHNEAAIGPWFLPYAAAPMCGIILAYGLMLRGLFSSRAIQARAVTKSPSDSQYPPALQHPTALTDGAGRQQTVSPGKRMQTACAPLASEAPVFAPLSRSLRWISASIGLIVLGGLFELLDILEFPVGGIDWPVNPRSLAATLFCVVTGTTLAKELLLQERHKHRLTASNRELYDLAQVRLQTTYDLQHQVQNKLAAIQWPLRNMQRGLRLAESQAPPDERRTHETRVGAVLEEVEDMYDMLNTMLNIARAEAGFTPDLGRKSVIDVPALAQNIARKCAQAEQEQLAETVCLPREICVTSELPCPTFRLYQMPLKQVLINLLENAIKYSPPGTPIRIHAWESADELYICVADDGKGLCAADLARIFDEAFYRGHDGGGTASGTGIGLNLCKRLIEAQKGHIWAESAGEGQGSSFLLRIPYERATAEDIEAA